MRAPLPAQLPSDPALVLHDLHAFDMAENELTVVRVSLGERSYEILIGSNWASEFGRAIRSRNGKTSANAMVFTSPVIGGFHYAMLANGLAQAGFTNVAS